jgi:hypothetical protein
MTENLMKQNLEKSIPEPFKLIENKGIQVPKGS